ncbi:MAG: ABC transporter substrate-binding protein [Sphaerochaetaceae bacterium]
MKKLVLAMLALLMVLLPLAAQATQEAAAVKDSATLVVAGNPYRFFALSPKGCGGDDNLVLSNVYDCLLCLEADGTLSPALAESYELSADGLTYTFHLRKGVKFSNGAEMTAEDVKFTFDKGAKGPLGQALFINFDHCTIIDAYTVEIGLVSPFAAFPGGVSSRLGGMCCKAYWDHVGDEGYMANPIGTGAYKLVEYVNGDHVKLEANADHWRGAPAIKTITIALVADVNTQILGLQNGDYDVMRNPSIEMCGRFDTMKGIKTSIGNSTARVTVNLNAWSGIGKDLNFRKAVQAAINKDDINKAVNSGAATILKVDICPMYGGYPDHIQGVAYDVAAAKAYLAKSSYNGEPFVITCTAGTTYETVAKVMQAQLIEIGIKCEVEAVDNMTYEERGKKRNFDARVVDEASSLIDADSIATQFTPSRFDQSVWYPRAAEIYAMAQKGRALQGKERTDLYGTIAQILLDEAYTIPLYNGINTVAFNENLNGVQAHCLGYYNFRFWSWK